MALHLLPIQWKLTVSRFFTFAQTCREQYNNCSPKVTHTHTTKTNRETNKFIEYESSSFTLRAILSSFDVAVYCIRSVVSSVALPWDSLSLLYNNALFLCIFNTNPLLQWHMYMRTLIKPKLFFDVN